MIILERNFFRPADYFTIFASDEIRPKKIDFFTVDIFSISNGVHFIQFLPQFAIVYLLIINFWMELYSRRNDKSTTILLSTSL